MAREPAVDRGWAWVILASNAVVMMIGGGVMYTMGVFNLIFLENFHGSKATIAGVGSLAMGLQYFTGGIIILIFLLISHHLTMVFMR